MIGNVNLTSLKSNSDHFTPGPWKVTKPGHGHPTDCLSVELDEKTMYATSELKAPDAYLIAACPRMLDAIEATLLFHSGDAWMPDKARRWKELTGFEEANTKNLCNFLREVQKEAGIR